MNDKEKQEFLKKANKVLDEKEIFVSPEETSRAIVERKRRELKYEQQNAKQSRDQIKAVILEPRFLNLSKPIQKRKLLSLLDDQASFFIEPLMLEFSRALDNIYSPDELKAFCDQIKKPGGLYETFRSGMVKINGTIKLPQIELFLTSLGNPYLEALAEILHSIRLIDEETNEQIEDLGTGKEAAKDKNGNPSAINSHIPESLSLIEYDGSENELINFFRIFREQKIIELPLNFDVGLFFGNGRVSRSQFKERGKIKICWRGLYGLVAFVRHLDTIFDTNLWANSRDPEVKGSQIKAVFNYKWRKNTIKEVNPASLTTYKTNEGKKTKTNDVFHELQKIYLYAKEDARLK